MKIIIIRHAEPDYPNNTLTPQGFIEAEALGKHYDASMFDDIYSSSLPRALLTAQAVVKGEKEIHVVDWLIEFVHRVKVGDNDRHLNWDFKPSFLKDHPEVYDNRDYLDCETLKTGNLKEEYEKVINEFDKVIEKHGYKKNGDFYDVIDGNTKTIVFFCHLGMMSVLLSRLLNIPYTALAQFMCCLPTGVTTVVSEEREKGIAQFRILRYGDLSHLEMENIEPSFAARFCEIYDSDDRH